MAAGNAPRPPSRRGHPERTPTAYLPRRSSRPAPSSPGCHRMQTRDCVAGSASSRHATRAVARGPARPGRRGQGGL